MKYLDFFMYALGFWAFTLWSTVAVLTALCIPISIPVMTFTSMIIPLMGAYQRHLA